MRTWWPLAFGLTACTAAAPASSPSPASSSPIASADPLVRQALQDEHGIRIVELDIRSLSSRDLITRVLSLLGNRVEYSEHRFAATEGSAPHRLTLKAWGFHLKERAMFVTDRQIPPALHRFFFEKGLDIVYFQ